MTGFALGTAEIERLICDPSSLGSLEMLMPRVADAWSSSFPNLTSLPHFEGPDRPLRVCIATEDIVGPVRNGGIGTTYAALATMLASMGIDTTILYLRGSEVENGTIDEWITYYGERKVKFVPVPNFAAADRFQTGADRWLRAPYNMLRYLLEFPMDVVHVSEWHGSAYLSLLAKRQGLAFSETLFIVKTSSPWLWNRIYGSQPLDRLEDLAKVHAERCSVEYADMVIGGSLHLLKWMASQGYQISKARTFVQPNVVTFEHLKHLIKARDPEKQTVQIDEFVFFGRLEGRKGLLTFCQAIKRLIRIGAPLPPKITFMGKPGGRLSSRPDQDITDFIAGETTGWPTQVKVLSDFQQLEAIQYLLEGPRLAVMPSVIENSSLAVYEAAICGIPFVASNSGGTPELVHEEDRDRVLCDGHPIPLSAKLIDAFQNGAYIARPSFDNDENLEVWRRFHIELGRGLVGHLLHAHSAPPVERTLSVATCIYYQGDESRLRATLVSLKAQEVASTHVVIAVDAARQASMDESRALAAEIGLTCEVVDAFDLDAGLAFNKAAQSAEADYYLFIWSGVTLRPSALRALTKVALSSGADLVNFFYRLIWEENGETKDFLKAHIIGSVTEAFFRTDIESVPLFVRSQAFRTIGGFSSDYRVVGHDHELIAKALVVGLKCETVLLELGTVPAWDDSWIYRECYDRSTSMFRAIRPQIAAVPLAIRELLLMSKGLQVRPLQRAKAPGAAKTVKGAVKPPPPRKYMDTMMSSFLGDTLPDKVLVKPPTKPKPAPGKASAATNSQPKTTPGGGASVEPDLPNKAPGAVVVGKRAPPAKAADGKPTPVEPPVGPPLQTKPPSVWSSLAPVANGGDNGARIEGRIFGIYRDKLHGFARDLLDDSVVLDVALRDQSGVIETCRASTLISTVYKKDGDPRGFVFDLGPIARMRRLFRPWRLFVQEVGTGTMLGSVIAPGIDRRLRSYHIEGFCDIGEGAVVRGWVWSPRDPEHTFDISVYVDRKFLTRVTAHAKRLDLENSNIGHGNYGFNIPIPKSLRTGQPHAIDVVVSDIGLRLTRGKLLLQGETLAFR